MSIIIVLPKDFATFKLKQRKIVRFVWVVKKVVNFAIHLFVFVVKNWIFIYDS